MSAPASNHPDEYVTFLHSQDRGPTARLVQRVLTVFVAFLTTRAKVVTTADAEDLRAYRLFLTTPEASADGRGLARSTQGTHLAMVRSFYRWLRRRHLVIGDPCKGIKPPRTTSHTVRKDYLDQQEAQAFLDTTAGFVETATPGSMPWAAALRDLALVAVAIATGRRRAGLCGLHVTDLDLERGELRVEREKGRPGRVLPMASWAVAITAAYLRQARPVLLRGREVPWLFVGRVSDRIGHETYAALIQRLHAATCASNPDLRGLPHKRITTHCLRVSCARLLFSNGCPIRSVNEILLHSNLSTTARYTPIPVEELRRVLATSHPRA